MAGRGRGRGGSRTTVGTISSFLGVDQAELRGQVSTQAHLFPPLINKPVPLVQLEDRLSHEALDYIVELKYGFVGRLKECGYYGNDSEQLFGRDQGTGSVDIKRYTDKLKKRIRPDFKIHWDSLPTELKPKAARRSKAKGSEVIAKGSDKAGSSENYLENLEKNAIEKLAKVKNMSSQESGDEKESSGDEGKEEKLALEQVEEDEEANDEEFNDYIDNYFDNGEDYGDVSEDNLEDSAVF